MKEASLHFAIHQTPYLKIWPGRFQQTFEADLRKKRGNSFDRKEIEVSASIESIVSQENRQENLEAATQPATTVEMQQLQPAGVKMLRFHRSKLIEVSEIKIKDGDLEELPEDRKGTIVQFTLF